MQTLIASFLIKIINSYLLMSLEVKITENHAKGFARERGV